MAFFILDGSNLFFLLAAKTDGWESISERQNHSNTSMFCPLSRRFWTHKIKILTMPLDRWWAEEFQNGTQRQFVICRTCNFPSFSYIDCFNGHFSVASNAFGSGFECTYLLLKVQKALSTKDEIETRWFIADFLQQLKSNYSTFYDFVIKKILVR